MADGDAEALEEDFREFNVVGVGEEEAGVLGLVDNAEVALEDMDGKDVRKMEVGADVHGVPPCLRGAVSDNDGGRAGAGDSHWQDFSADHLLVGEVSGLVVDGDPGSIDGWKLA